eukprot:TRINITY_DN924_c0_g1_i1.p1 TRINITY_DN924_c0_g1~~TRINITY_DN924_c0_g1_i1.p1  ORF type:complete len:245 (-),score=35.03 TRINITY_DN924_c0_g1_i1:296-1030(-)
MAITRWISIWMPSQELIHHEFQIITTLKWGGRFSVLSADFCSKVIAEAQITQTMDAYHDPGRKMMDTTYKLEDMVYVKAEYDSPDATIYDVTILRFDVENLGTGVTETLYEVELSSTGYVVISPVSNINAQFQSSVIKNGVNPVIVLPEFILTDQVFHISGGRLPVTFELTLEVNITFKGNENDLLEMLEPKYLHTEIKRQIYFFPDGLVEKGMETKGVAADDVMGSEILLFLVMLSLESLLSP